MRKVLVILPAAVFLIVGLAAQVKPAGEKKEQQAAAKKEVRWQGHIVRSSKEQSTVTVRSDRPGAHERIVVYNTSTKWTKYAKPADPSEFKDGSFVICLGKYDQKGRFIASRIELRAPK